VVVSIVGRRSELRYPPYTFGQKSGTPPVGLIQVTYLVKCLASDNERVRAPVLLYLCTCSI
jgi:hypothetical protein